MRARFAVRAAMLAALLGCGGSKPTEPITPPPPTVVSLFATEEDTLIMGATFQSRATAVYTGGSERLVPATWSSSNSLVATVSDGLITAVAPGTTDITAAFGGKSASFRLTVWNPLTAWSLLSPGGLEYFQDRETFPDGIVMKWPGTAFPLKAWAPTTSLKEDLAVVLAYWGEKTGGEVSYQGVSDSASAQILLVSSDNVPYPACGDLYIWQEGGAISKVVVRVSTDGRCPLNDDDRRKTGAHEVGHGLGLSRHSRPGEDLMSPEGATWHLEPVTQGVATWLNMPIVLPGLPIPAQRRG